MAEQLISLFENFIQHGTYLRNWSPKTVRTYRQGFASLQASLGDVCGSTVTKQGLEAWVIQMRAKGMVPAGCNCHIRTINSFLSWLKEDGHIAEQLRIKLLPNPSKPLKGFSDIEIRSLLSFRPSGFTDLRTWTLIQVLMDTGLRIEEALTLQIINTDFENMILTVKGKGNKERKVPYSTELRKVLWRYINHKSMTIAKAGQVFRTRSGHRLSYRNSYRDIKNLCYRAGVSGEHVHPHAFRHHFAVTYIRYGGDIYRLSRILGHTSISTTQIYLRSMGIEQIGENHSSLSPLSRH